MINHIIQTMLGVVLGMLGDGDVAGKEEHSIAVWAKRIGAALRTLPSLLSFIEIGAEGLARNLAGSGIGFGRAAPYR